MRIVYLNRYRFSILDGSIHLQYTTIAYPLVIKCVKASLLQTPIIWIYGGKETGFIIAVFVKD